MILTSIWLFAIMWASGNTGESTFKILSAETWRYFPRKFRKRECARLLNSGISKLRHVIYTKVEYYFRLNQLKSASRTGAVRFDPRIYLPAIISKLVIIWFEKKRKIFNANITSSTNAYVISEVGGTPSPRSNTLSFYIPFFQKRHLFRIPFIGKRHPFHIPS